jgi:8-oxo-dGTP pyrophosphatase MutT (NUDIX family)
MRNELLLQQLTGFEPYDGAEAEHRAAIVNLLTNGEAAFSRDHFGPGHLTASCFIIDPATHRLLLHHHRRLGRWLQMGGHVEPDEFPPQAALREGAEESGLRDLRLLRASILDLDVHPIPAAKGEPDHHHFDVRYVAITNEPGTIARDANESNDLAWFDFDRAAELMSEDASTRAIRKIRGLL